jgi:hypothetical protein
MTAAHLFPTAPPARGRRVIPVTSPTGSDQSAAPAARGRMRDRRRRDERGEGVISAAIAVLIMAFLGVGMWVAFNTTFQHTAKNVDKQVNSCIGQTNPNC